MNTETLADRIQNLLENHASCFELEGSRLTTTSGCDFPEELLDLLHKGGFISSTQYREKLGLVEIEHGEEHWTTTCDECGREFCGPITDGGECQEHGNYDDLTIEERDEYDRDRHNCTGGDEEEEEEEPLEVMDFSVSQQ